MVSRETQENGIVEIWSLRDLLNSFGLLELLCLVKVTQTHTQPGLQSSSQGFLSHGLHFPFPAIIFYLQSLILYLYFLPPFLLPLVLFQHHLNFDPYLAPSTLLTLCSPISPFYLSSLPFHSHPSMIGLLLQVQPSQHLHQDTCPVSCVCISSSHLQGNLDHCTYHHKLLIFIYLSHALHHALIQHKNCVVHSCLPSVYSRKCSINVCWTNEMDVCLVATS